MPPQLELIPEETAPLLLLVDGYNMIFRSFTSVPRSITDPEGNAVNGVYGLLGTTLRMIKDRKPTHIAVAFDRPEGPTYRHDLFTAYQGQRGPLGGEYAESFEWQVVQAIRVLEHFGMTCLSKLGFEADDILGTLAVQASSQGMPSLIVTTDRDLQQLVGPLVRVLIPGKKPLEIGPEDVKVRLGIRPDQIVDWKTMAGDPSDNLPGVAGIGDKSAISLLEQYDTLENIYANLEAISSRQRTALENGRDDAKMFAKIVKIQTDLPIDVDIETLRIDFARLPVRAGDGLRELGLRPAE